MTKERFQSGFGFLLALIVGICIISFISHAEGRLPSGSNLYLMVILGIIVILVEIRSKNNTYLEITDSRLLKNSGYHDFAKDILDIRNIKYIYRVPQFPLAWFGGSLMVIYTINDEGKMRHSALRETNYPEDTLKKFLVRIREIKSTIELDAEYLQILEEKRSFREASDNTVASVEQRLRDKGEKWDATSGFRKFIGKL